VPSSRMVQALYKSVWGENFKGENKKLDLRKEEI
jgi:hypothetical protein